MINNVLVNPFINKEKIFNEYILYENKIQYYTLYNQFTIYIEKYYYNIIGK